MTENTCAGGDPVGTVVPYNYTLAEQGPSNGYVLDGANADVYDAAGVYLGAGTLYWPTLTISYYNQYGGLVTLTMTFRSASTGIADLLIQYSDCSISYADR